MKRICLTILLFSLCQAVTASPASPRDEAYPDLGDGEIAIVDSASDGPGGTVRVLSLFQTSAEAAWDVITSCAQMFRFVAGLEQCEVLEDSGDRALVRQVANEGWPRPRLEFTYESLREPYRSIRFRMLEGNLRVLEGHWQFNETGQGLIVDYRIRIKPRWLVPDFFVSRALGKRSPAMIACIRGLAGGSGDPEREARDLEQCQQPPPAVD